MMRVKDTTLTYDVETEEGERTELAMLQPVMFDTTDEDAADRFLAAALGVPEDELDRVRGSAAVAVFEQTAAVLIYQPDRVERIKAELAEDEAEDDAEAEE